MTRARWLVLALCVALVVVVMASSVAVGTALGVDPLWGLVVCVVVGLLGALVSRQVTRDPRAARCSALCGPGVIVAGYTIAMLVEAVQWS